MNKFTLGTPPPYSKYKLTFHNYEVDTIEHLCVWMAENPALTPYEISERFSMFYKSIPDELSAEHIFRITKLLDHLPMLTSSNGNCGAIFESPTLKIYTDSKGFEICSAGTAASCILGMMETDTQQTKWNIHATHTYALDLRFCDFEKTGTSISLSISEKVIIGEIIRHMNDRAHYQIPRYNGEQFGDDIKHTGSRTYKMDRNGWIFQAFKGSYLVWKSKRKAPVGNL